MTIARMVELLAFEHACMLRNSHGDCDRCCENCNLVQDDGELHEMYTDVIALLKAQEPRVMTLEEIKDYLDDPDGDKKPLWLEWHSIPALSGWVLASQVSDLMKRYMDSYNNTWRPWTSRPTEAEREAVKWE